MDDTMYSYDKVKDYHVVVEYLGDGGYEGIAYKEHPENPSVVVLGSKAEEVRNDVIDILNKEVDNET